MQIYALLDMQTLRKKQYSIEKFILTCKKLHVTLLQYRDKKGAENEKIENLKKIKSLCNIPIILNDDLELIEFADGLHVGQEDLKNISSNKIEAIKKIRKKIGRKILGVSTHNKEEILEANSFDVDYIGLGAYRSTDTKSDATVLKESLSSLAGLSLKPVGAIGGVRINDKIANVTYLVVGSDIYAN
jgi:thiamine-phosphate pyrophosphorylase